ncbi:Low molecular weight protein-tyrosine-phosphatase wzb [Moraxella lacunata]|nr:Low molecular weight protein-tyrosine-phosphatase wzb [Moraxella lacunata]
MTKLTKNQGLRIHFDSAGTGNHHVGEKPDPRAIDVGSTLDFDLTSLRARQLTTQDFYDFDVIFAMDNNNLANIKKVMPSDATAQVVLFDKFTKQEVADPYYGDVSDFRTMFGYIERVSRAWLDLWQSEK